MDKARIAGWVAIKARLGAVRFSLGEGGPIPHPFIPHPPLVLNLVHFHKKHAQYTHLNSRLCQIPLIVPRIAQGPLAIHSWCHCPIKYPKPLTCSCEQ